jgi:hypothetical protein
MTIEARHNENVKKAITDTLKRMSVEVEGILVPLLSKNTEQIVFNCHGGTIVDLKPLLKIK